MRERLIGGQELEVLRYVADHGPVTVGQTADGFGGPRGLARSTVLTVMERLREKGYLCRRQEHGVFHYASTESQADVLRGLVGTFVERSLSGSLSPFVAYLSEAAEVSEVEIAELQAILSRLQAQRRQKSR